MESREGEAGKKEAAEQCKSGEVGNAACGIKPGSARGIKPGSACGIKLGSNRATDPEETSDTTLAL